MEDIIETISFELETLCKMKNQSKRSDSNGDDKRQRQMTYDEESKNDLILFKEIFTSFERGTFFLPLGINDI
jgi:hypothetical protein